MKLKALVKAVVTVVLGATLLAQDQARERKLQQAIDLLETKGDATRAMPLLEDVAKSADQSLAARGLLYLGQAQEKQGNARARATYERIVRDFGQQQQIVAQARSRLVALEGRGGAPTGITSRLLRTLPPGVWVLGSASPDGRYIPYESAGALLVHNLVDGTARTIATPAKGDWVEESALSHDGQQLAYVWFNNAARRYELRVADVLGSGVSQHRTVLEDAEIAWLKPHDWTPDGKHIVLEIAHPDRASEIALLSVQDRSRRSLKSGKWGIREMKFSPDGRMLAFDHRASDSEARDIYVLSVDGSGEIPAVVHRADDLLVGWSPDGKRLLFLSDRGGATGLWAQAVDNGAPRGVPVLLKGDFGEAVSARVGSRGALYSVTASRGPSSVDIKTGTVDFATGEWITPPRDVVREYSVGSTQFPEWSPDGQSLAYVTRRTSMRGDDGIAFRSVPGGSVREIRPGLTLINRLRWTSDSRAVLANGSDYTGRRAWWHVDAVTGEMQLFEPTHPSGHTNVTAWSRDGSKVYLNRPISDTEIVLIERDLASKNERELFRGLRGPDPRQTAAQPQVSRDGLNIYFRKFLTDGSKPPFRNVAFVERNLASGVEREIARGQFGGIVVSPDAKYIATASNDQSSNSRLIVLIPTMGGKPREIFRVPLPPGFAAGPATLNPLRVEQWAPDNSSVLVVKSFAAAKPSELWWVPTDGRMQPKQLDPNYQGASTIRVHPDGRQMVFQVAEETIQKAPEVWVLEGVIK